jgi:uncharacterized protein (TIGR03083 family)
MSATLAEVRESYYIGPKLGLKDPSMDDYWSAVTAMRLTVADLLEELTPQEWDRPSLCQGWRVRDVAGHLSLVPTLTTWELLRAAPRCGFDPHRINTLLARRYGDRSIGSIVSRIRDHAGDRRTAKVLDVRDSLFDVVVHSQDIAVPLGRTVDVPVASARAGLDRVWEMGWPFRARRRLSGWQLRATDTDWQRGEGPLVEGTALALLLLLTGRSGTAAPLLSGNGVESLPAS